MPPTTTFAPAPARRESGPGCRHYRVYPAEIRADKKPDGSYFEGMCAVYHAIDDYGTIMGKGCFDRDIDYFRKNGFIGGLNHNWNDPIGTPDPESGPNEHGLRVVCSNVLDTEHGLTVRKLLKAGVCKKLSLGFGDLEKRWLDKEEDVRSYWQAAGYMPRPSDEEACKRGALLFTRIKVYEASPVMVPGNQYADITEVRTDDSADYLPNRQTGYQSLETHLLTVRAAVATLADRIEQLAALRASDGRSLPPERRAILHSIKDRIDRALTACQPRAQASEVMSLRRELLELETSILTS